jgi:hypothetical protein
MEMRKCIFGLVLCVYAFTIQAQELTNSSQSNLDQTLKNFLNEKLRVASTQQDLDENVKRINQFEKNFDSYIQNTLLKDPNAKFLLPKIEQNWKQLNEDKNRIITYKLSIKKSVNSIYAENDYNKMKLINIKWSLLSKAFPESEILKDAVKESLDALAFEGGKEGVLKIVDLNKGERATKVKMTPAVTNDPSIIAQITIALKESSFGKQRTIIKINVLNSDWSIKRNELTGIISHRYKYFEAALKNSDGSCVLLKVCWYQQDHIGSGYGKGYITQGELHEIMCENVDK